LYKKGGVYEKIVLAFHLFEKLILTAEVKREEDVMFLKKVFL